MTLDLALSIGDILLVVVGIAAAVLAPISTLPNICYTVDLPINDEIHISFSITYEDALKRRWSTSGFANLINGKREVTYSPSAQVK